MMSGQGYWWSSSVLSGSDAWFRNLYFYASNFYRYIGYSRAYGFSVRCLKD
jgi:hypothetical protein